MLESIVYYIGLIQYNHTVLVVRAIDFVSRFIAWLAVT